MGPITEEDDRAIDSSREPLLLENISHDGDVDPEISDRIRDVGGRDVAMMEHIGPRHNYYATAQWIWLCLAWSIMSDNYLYVFDASILGYILILFGHGFFLLKLSRSPECKPSRLAQVNQENLPAILSGLRVLGVVLVGHKESAVEFLVTVAAVFLLFEVCGGFWCSAFYRMLIQEVLIFHDMEGSVDSNIPTRMLSDRGHWQRSWSAIGQWIWILLVWSVLTRYLYSDVIWIIAMFGHKILFVMPSVCGGKRPSLFRINRESVPIMLSACLYFCSTNDAADQYLITIAACFLLTQTPRAVRRFFFIMTSITTMENDYFESLKENEAEEAAHLEKQMERMSYLDSLHRSGSVKGSRKRLILIFYFLLALYGAFDVRKKFSDISSLSKSYDGSCVVKSMDSGRFVVKCPS